MGGDIDAVLARLGPAMARSRAKRQREQRARELAESGAIENEYQRIDALVRNEDGPLNIRDTVLRAHSALQDSEARRSFYEGFAEGLEAHTEVYSGTDHLGYAGGAILAVLSELSMGAGGWVAAIPELKEDRFRDCAHEILAAPPWYSS